MITKTLVTAAVLFVFLAGCMGSAQVTPASEAIEMKRAGADEATMLRWVNDPDRTFDLSDEDVMELASSDLSQPVINAMLRKSEEHHRKEERSGEHTHSH